MIEAPNVQRLLNKPAELQPAQVMKLWRHRPKIFFKDVLDFTPLAWQDECTDLYMQNDRLAMVASKGVGKFEPLDREIYTPKGKIKFGDLKPGDLVFAESGKPTKVLMIHPQGVQDIYEVTFDDGSKSQCGLEHLWKVRGVTEKRKNTWAVKSLGELLEEGITKMQGKQTYFPWQIPAQGAAEYPHANLPLDPYVLGVWIGDGSRRSNAYSKYDIEVEQEINRRGYQTHRRFQKDRCDTIIIPGIEEHLKSLGLYECYSYEKFIPEVYKTASIAQRMDLLRGLMDTDGTIDTRCSKACEYNTTSPKLAEDVMWLIRSLGGKTTMGTRIPKLNGKEYRMDHRVRVTTPFNPFFLTRKGNHWKKPSQDRYLCRTIKHVEKVRRCEAMCITVEDENHCYLTNDFIVTHNTGFLAAVTWHFFITQHLPKIAVLSVTKDHLMANLWAELLKARAQSKLLTASANEGFSKITLKGHEGYAFIDARSFPKSADEKQQASALAGLHADNVAFMIDEAGSIPDGVIQTADAALSTGSEGNKRARLIVTANPEEPKGIIYRACMGKTIQKWATYRVSGDPDDPKRSPLVSVDWARDLIAQYGKDDPYVMVNVLGKYPATSANMLITEQEVADAMNREIPEQTVQNSQMRLGIDVARGGVDSTVFILRKGLKAYPLEQISSNVLGPELAGKAAFICQERRVERVFVDNTGGFGSSVVDSLSMFPNIDITPIHYNSKAQDTRYFNKRTEMWVRMRDWIRKGGALPKDPGLAEEITMPKLIFHNGVFRLEEKEQIKQRLGRSPDKADALAQTFADVEQPSFYAEYAEKSREFKDPLDYYRNKSQARTYYSDNSQVDKFYYSPPNYKA